MDTVDGYKAMTEQLLEFGDSENNIFLQSLEAAAFLQDDPQPYLEAFAEVVAPAQTQLDLHLVGSGIHRHEAEASQVGKFLTSVSNAVKHLAKDIVGSEFFRPRDIKVQGIQPGSVRLVLNAPENLKPKTSVPEGKGIEEATVEEEQTPESRALWQIANVFTQSSSADDASDEEPELLAQMSAKTRKDLKVALGILKKNDWQIEGTATVRGLSQERVELTARGTAKLADALSLEKPASKPKKAIGWFSGHRAWDKSELYFVPDQGKKITLKTNDLQLLSIAARLSSDEENKAEIYYVEISHFDSDGQLVPGKTTRQLTKVKPYKAYLQGEQGSLTE